MNLAVGTLAYLVTRTFRNRVITMARRLRQPKYALGFAVGVLYFGFIVFGQTRGGGDGPNLFQNDSFRALAPLFLVLILAMGWFASGAQSALAFLPAEVALLFPAPVTRRELILYKLAGAQIPVIVNALILAFIFGGGLQEIPRWLAFASLWTMFATISLHRLGAALVRASLAEHGVAGAKRTWVSYVIGLTVLAVIILAVVPHQVQLEGASSPIDFMSRFEQLLSAPAVRAVLYPFALMIAPAFAQTVGEWSLAMIPAIALLAAHLIWVLRSDVAFEEAAVEASAKRQAVIDNVRRRGISGANEATPKATRTIPLGSTGHPAIAIVWKNLLGLMRTTRPSQFIGILVLPVVAALILGKRSGDPALIVAGVTGMIAMVTFIAGPMTVRNDLRADLLNIESLKTFPLRGRELVLAEVTSSALPLSLFQFVLLGIAAVALQSSQKPLPFGVTIAVVVTLPIALFGLNLCYSTIQNGIAVLFPGWIRLGSEGQGVGAVDMMGQAILGMMAMLIAFLICLILPALVAFIVFTMVKPPAVVAAGFVMVVGSLALVGESYAMMLGLGRALERLEPSQVG
ncbi:MAG: hypothetical protein O2973_05925 [Gemmatimonadetes bacterium]|nr:hypothetical protein [Gemmatimonadota bacterium]